MQVIRRKHFEWIAQKFEIANWVCIRCRWVSTFDRLSVISPICKYCEKSLWNKKEIQEALDNSTLQVIANTGFMRCR